MNKVLAIFGGMAFYYNDILNRINQLPDIELITVSPLKSKTVGSGVHTTIEGIDFRHIELEEVNVGYDYILKGLTDLIEKEKPRIVLTVGIYLSFLYHSKEFINLKNKLKFKLLLKDHPFRLLTYDSVKEEIKNCDGSDSILFKKLNKIRLPIYTHFILWVLKNKRFKQLEDKKNQFNFADAIICYVDEAFEIFGSYGVKREKIFISRNSTNTDKIEEVRQQLNGLSEYPYNPFRLIHISRLIEWKRVDLIMDAIDILKGDFPEIDLLVVGEGPMEKPWKELAKSMNLEKKVIFHGPSYDTLELGKLCNSAELYVLGGMGGLSINDAMAFGLPVICSVCDGTEKFLVRESENGIYFTEGSALSLAESIKKYFSLNEERKLAMKEKSLKIIREEVNVNTVVAKYEEVFNYLLRDDK